MSILAVGGTGTVGSHVGILTCSDDKADVLPLGTRGSLGTYGSRALCDGQRATPLRRSR